MEETLKIGGIYLSGNESLGYLWYVVLGIHEKIVFCFILGEFHDTVTNEFCNALIQNPNPQRFCRMDKHTLISCNMDGYLGQMQEEKMNILLNKLNQQEFIKLQIGMRE